MAGGGIGRDGLVFDLLAGKTAQAAVALSPSLVANLIVEAPKHGAQRQILDLLLKQYPAAVSFEELHQLLGYVGSEGIAAPALMTAVSRLNEFLKRFRLKAAKTDKSYQLVEYEPD